MYLRNYLNKVAETVPSSFVVVASRRAVPLLHNCQNKTETPHLSPICIVSQKGIAATPRMWCSNQSQTTGWNIVAQVKRG